MRTATRRRTPVALAVLAAIASALRPASSAAQPRDLGLVSYQAPSIPRLDADGSAVVAFTIRANGRIQDALTLSATNRVLGNSAREAVTAWRFESDPVLGRGRDAVPSLVLRRQIIEFVFKRGGVVESVSHYDSGKYWFPPDDEAAPTRLVRSAELETPLVRLPTPPSGEAEKLLDALTESGVVIVSFVVDEEGGVRVPVAERTEDPLFMQAALALVGGWRFEPPTLDGKPVLVEERNTLTFRPRPR